MDECESLLGDRIPQIKIHHRDQGRGANRYCSLAGKKIPNPSEWRWLILLQLDERYFRGLKGQYDFTLSFQLKAVGSKTPICQVRPVHTWDRRSINCELELEPGTYEVIPKIETERFEGRSPVEKVVKKMADRNPQKLRQVGLQYDLAHAKGGVVDEDEELEKKKARQKLKKTREKRKENRIQEMENAMGRMEMAMLQMRNEMLRERDMYDDHQYHQRRRREHRRHEKEPEKEDEKHDEKEKTDGEGEKSSRTKPPGCWPEESQRTEAELEPAKDMPPPPGTSTEPKGEGAPADDGEKTEDEKQEDEAATTNPPETVPPKETEAEQESVEQEGQHEVPPPPPSTPPTPPSEPSIKSDSSDASDSSDSDTASEVSDLDSDSEDDRRPRRPRKKEPWNAVCVLGLRVYAQHADVKVRLAEPKDDEEAAGLVIDGKPVGPTS